MKIKKGMRVLHIEDKVFGTILNIVNTEGGKKFSVKWDDGFGTTEEPEEDLDFKTGEYNKEFEALIK